MRLTTLFVAMAAMTACAEPTQPPQSSVETPSSSAPRQPRGQAAPPVADAPRGATPTAAQVADLRRQIAIAQARVDNLGNIGESSTKELQLARTRVSDLKAALEVLLRAQTDAASATPEG